MRKLFRKKLLNYNIMSSRSLATARARRTGENPPPVSGNRPGTSIGSHAAFAQPMPNGMGYNMPPQTTNIRTTQHLNQKYNKEPHQTQPHQTQPHQTQPSQTQPPKYPNGLTFNKLSVSDAFGLVTLRLGRVEQWIIDTDHENDISSSIAIVDGGDNVDIGIDNATLTNMINRLDSLEKNSGQGSQSNDVNKLIEDVLLLTSNLKKMGDDVTKHTLELSKHTLELSKNTQEVFKFKRELVETKDILKSFMIKYDMFVNETSQNFSDYEGALGDLEKRLPHQHDPEYIIQDVNTVLRPNDVTIADGLPEDKPDVEPEDGYEDKNIIMTDDLKNVIKQELSKI